jgi:branched-chain amino acid transport system permease protein
MLTQGNQINLIILAILTCSMAMPLRAGLLSLAPIGMANIGGYGAALLLLHTSLGPIVAVLAAMAGGAVLSAFLSFPLARMRGLYTSIGTLAFLVIVTDLATSASITGGSLGLIEIPFYNMVGIGLVVLGGAVAILYWLDHSTFGRRIDLVGHDEDLARSLGVSITATRVVSQVIAGALAGFAGAAYVMSFYIMTPGIFDFYFAVQIVAFLFLGGAGYWLGPLIGSLLLGGLSVWLTNLGYWSDVISGGVMVLIIIVYPEGIGGLLRNGLRYRGWAARQFRRGRFPLPSAPAAAMSASTASGGEDQS